MLRGNSGGFPCHRTTVGTENDDLQETKDSKHCAGALIYAEKQEASTQMMRIAERLGMYDRHQLRGHELIWDSQEEWMEGGATW